MKSPSQHSTHNNAASASRNAALFGATAAFARNPNVHGTSPEATRPTGAAPRPSVRSPVSAPAQNAFAEIQESTAQAPRNVLRVPGNVIKSTSLSPSSIAAGQAAARSPPSNNPPINTQRSQARSRPNVSRSSTANTQQGSSPTMQKNPLRIQKLDETAIPPTSALVKLFEQNGMEHKESSVPTPIQSPRPIRKSGLLEQDARLALLPRVETKNKGVPAIEDETLSSPESFRSARDRMSPTKSQAPTVRDAFANRPTISLTEGSPALSPAISPERKDSKANVLHTTPIAISRPRTRPSPCPSPSYTGGSSQSITATYHQLHPRRMTSLTTGESLANAIVASSLASSRAPSPTKVPSLPLRPAKSHHSLFTVRTPSPAKRPGLRQTMRKASTTGSSSDDDDDPYSKHKKKRHIRKHPNKHHEGDRKRWRNAVTERERKRYEGVWAANKGLHLPLTAEQDTLVFQYIDGKMTTSLRDSIGDQVSSVVVRDIWSRSRLPEQVLMEVWELVDGQGVGRLTKEEFVVGLWLVDQRLKGRKLPVKVSESVWNSVKFLQGIKIRK